MEPLNKLVASAYGGDVPEFAHVAVAPRAATERVFCPGGVVVHAQVQLVKVLEGQAIGMLNCDVTPLRRSK